MLTLNILIVGQIASTKTLEATLQSGYWKSKRRIGKIHPLWMQSPEERLDFIELFCDPQAQEYFCAFIKTEEIRLVIDLDGVIAHEASDAFEKHGAYYTLLENELDATEIATMLRRAWAFYVRYIPRPPPNAALRT